MPVYPIKVSAEPSVNRWICLITAVLLIAHTPAGNSSHLPGTSTSAMKRAARVTLPEEKLHYNDIHVHAKLLQMLHNENKRQEKRFGKSCQGYNFLKLFAGKFWSLTWCRSIKSLIILILGFFVYKLAHA